MSSLTWLAVPQRIVGGQAHVSVLIVPRLGAGRLEDFGLRDWPARLVEMSLLVRTRSAGVQRTADRRPALVSAPDSEIWHAFFDGDAGTIDEPAGRRGPETPTVRDRYSDAVRTQDTHRTMARSIARNGVTGEVVDELSQWSRRDNQVEPDTGLQARAPHVDFHRAVALLREHPRVMRALGLVFDVTIDADVLDVGDPTDRALAITSEDSPVPVVSPWTRYTRSGSQFRASESPASLLRRGMLDIHTARPVADLARQPDGSLPPAPPWLISTMDIDGALDSLGEAAEALVQDEPLLLPRARSAGLALVRPGRQSDFDAMVQRANSQSADASDVELTADDLVLGYRVDIRRGGGAWRSLCERDASYEVRSVADGRALQIGDPGPEEGHVKPNAALRHDDGTLETDEVVLRWDGWSLAMASPAAERPFRLPSDLPYDFAWTFDVPRAPSGAPLPSLPALRFAERYRMRVRVADVTGGGPRRDEPDLEDAASPSILYVRHEAVEPPTLDSRDALQLGASNDVLVVSSDLDDAHETVTRRTLIPPTGSFQLAEQHRMFDNAAAKGLAQHAFDRSARNEPPDLPDPAAEGVLAFAPVEPGGLEQPWEGEAEWPAWPTLGSKEVTLIGLPDPDAEIDLDFDDAGLTVRLPRAEQITVELSSTIRDDFLDHFALRDWITGAGAPQAWSDAALRGRHPMLSPVRRLTFVHVVKQPLVAPAWELPGTAVTRPAGGSYVTLAPTFRADGLDTDSTARLEVAARWTEFSDTGTTPEAVSGLHAVTIARGAPAIPAFRHELGDTKHRFVTYELTAISRFRHFFPDTEPDAAFQRSLEQPEHVNVLSTARPPAPRVLATLPAFAWESTAAADRITRRRRVTVRVELARPWFVTGEGERLAVVVATPGTPPDDAMPVTLLGRDPVLAAAPVPVVARPDWFVGASLPPTEVELPERDVLVVGYDVHDAGTHWYADVGIDLPAGAYAPFVRLVVARYQPDSLGGLELSDSVVCDPVRVLPERLLTVERAGSTLSITVTGPSPQPANRVEAVIDELPAEHDPASTELLALTDASPVPAWRARPDSAVTDVVGSPMPPLTVPRTGGHLRLRVREVEGIAADAVAVGPPELVEQTPWFDVVPLPESWRSP